jgi:serine/threonine-protein kinase
LNARDPFQLIGTTIAGKYRVDRVLGEGGCGIVYAGLHVVVGAPVAIKCLKPVSGDRTAEARMTEAFLREAKLLFALTHPGIVRLYDVGALEGANPVPWVVLELIDGPTLEAELARRASESRHFTAHELLQLFDPVLDAVAFAHDNAVAHRDLKPSNVMLPRTPTGALQPKVLDFGIARRIGEQRQTIGVTAFTPRYAAPEQWDGSLGTTGPASDVFALGLMLAEACTLRPALPGESAASLVAAVMDPNRRIVVVTQRPDLPPEIDRIVARATSVRIGDRFQHARELQIAFRTALGASPASIMATAPIAAPNAPKVSGQAASWENLPGANPTTHAPPPAPTPRNVTPAGAASYPPMPATPMSSMQTQTPVIAPAPPAAKSSNALLGAIVALLAILVVLGVVLVVALSRPGDAPPTKTAAKADDHSVSTKKSKNEKSSTPSDDSDDDDDDPPTKKKKPRKGSVKLANAVGPQFYSQSQIYDVIDTQSGPLLECYHGALEKDPYTAGQVTVITDVTPAGKVETPTGATGIGDDTFRACVAARMTDWKFPKPYPKDGDDFILILEFHP